VKGIGELAVVIDRVADGGGNPDAIKVRIKELPMEPGRLLAHIEAQLSQ
jgi:hypothetical protein